MQPNKDEKADFCLSHLMPGFYTPGHSILHKMPVGWKIFLALAMLCLAALSHWRGIAAVFLACLAGNYLAQIGIKVVLQKMRTFVWFVLFLGLFPVFLTPGTAVQTGVPMGLTWEGLEAGAHGSCRLLIMFLISMIFVQTTKPAELFNFMKSGENQGHRFSVPFRQAATVGLMAFQLLPILCEEVEKRLITELQARKDEIRGNLFNKARQVATLLIPLTVSIFENTEQFSKRLNSPDQKK